MSKYLDGIEEITRECVEVLETPPSPIDTPIPTAVSPPLSDLPDFGDFDLDDVTALLPMESSVESSVDEIAREVERAVLAPFEEERAAPARESLLKSELSGVSDEKWTKFAKAMRTQEVGAISASNEMGLFAMKPRRLADLGIMRELNQVRAPTGRMIWVGAFAAPLTQDAFLRSPKVQYIAFADSMRRYADDLQSKKISRPDKGVDQGTTRSGVLAILHKSGLSGLQHWGDKEKRFPNTVDLFHKVNGIF
jgi:hypothetical protein